MNGKYIDAKARELFLNASGIVEEGDSGSTINDLEVITSKVFIKTCCKKLRQKNAKISSYGLKHAVEKWGKETNKLLGKKAFSEYVSNGAFIKGANKLGFVIYPIGKSHNCNFNISIKR